MGASLDLARSISQFPLFSDKCGNAIGFNDLAVGEPENARATHNQALLVFYYLSFKY
jgi:hypothetical protein